MKAVMYTEYGSPDVLKLTEIAKPTPKDNEILIKVYATPVGYGDLLVRNFKDMRREFNMPSLFWLPARIEFGYRKPKRQILGAEFAGVVESIGKNVTRFKKAILCLAILVLTLVPTLSICVCLKMDWSL